MSSARSRTTLVAAVALVASVAAALTVLSASAARAGAPRLVVVLVIDQLRSDYLERYSTRFAGGLLRLMRDGAWFTEAAYPYLNTVTCAGHATIGTGTFPYRHGMVLNSWYDRKTAQTVYCTDDPSYTEVSYNGLTSVQGDSANRIQVPSIGDYIRKRTNGRAVAFSLKPRSAITLVGKSADAVTWFDERGGWVTSSAFTKKPVAFVQAFVAANPITADYDKVWNRTLEASAYQYEDDVEGERPSAGSGRTFPHVLGQPGGRPDQEFYTRWQRSPFSDEYLERMAAHAVDALTLGKGSGIDLLAVGFSALDSVGHSFGPRSHEVQDILIRLDLTIGRLLEHLDRQVGRDNYVLALSSDHGVSEIPIEGQRGGRQAAKEIRQAVQAVLGPALGPGDHVLATAHTDVYLSKPAVSRLRGDDQLMTAVLDALRKLPGVAHAFPASHLSGAQARGSSDAAQRAAALSYYPGRSGDIILVPKEHWLFSTAVTTHGTLYSYDQRVPVILFGPAVRPGKYTDPATPADILPTIAALARFSVGRTDGRALRQAIQLPPTTSHLPIASQVQTP